jgi:hypothetical protein
MLNIRALLRFAMCGATPRIMSCITYWVILPGQRQCPNQSHQSKSPEVIRLNVCHAAHICFICSGDFIRDFYTNLYLLAHEFVILNTEWFDRHCSRVILAPRLRAVFSPILSTAISHGGKRNLQYQNPVDRKKKV